MSTEAMYKRRLMTLVESICPGYAEPVENATLKAISCFELLDEESETACSLVKNSFKTCISPIVNVFEECLPATGKQLPNFAVDAVLAVSEHICRIDGEHIIELSNKCFRNVNYRTQKCIKRNQAKVQQYLRDKKFPSVQETCELMDSNKACLDSHLASACGNSITREAFLDVFKVLKNVCNTYSQSSQNNIELLY